MNTPDTQQRNSKRLRKFLLVYPALLLLLVVAIRWASSAFAPTFTYAEMVTISLQSTEKVLTENTYSGWVYLRISGLGRIGADRYSNAFCAYDSGGNVLSADTISPAGYGIAADGMVHLDDFTATYGPRFLPLDDRRCQTEDHIYIIGYYVGETPRRIAFNSVDATVEDNSGTFTVEVAVQPPPEVRGQP